MINITGENGNKFVLKNVSALGLPRAPTHVFSLSLLYLNIIFLK